MVKHNKSVRVAVRGPAVAHPYYIHTYIHTFIPGEITPGVQWIGDWVGPRAGLDAVENRKSGTYRDSNSDPSIIAIPIALYLL
jgi:hypothetical protein